ncbi:Uncharacterised protein [uncultured archaeon]|nr:Uncharacterised protein [uncultured archaeon]
MKCVFEAPMDKKAELTKLLEADPYGEQSPAPYQKMSFARLGYKLKEGVQVNEEKDKLYAVFRGSDDYLPFIKSKLEGLAVQSNPERSARVIAAVEDEESGAEQGMGAIFG